MTTSDLFIAFLAFGWSAVVCDRPPVSFTIHLLYGFVKSELQVRSGLLLI